MFMCSSTTQRSNDCKTRPKTNILQTCGKNLRCYRELICLVDWLNDVSASEMLAVGSSTKEMLSDTMVLKCQYPVKITHMPPDQTDCDGSFAKNQTCRHQSRLNDSCIYHDKILGIHHDKYQVSCQTSTHDPSPMHITMSKMYPVLYCVTTIFSWGSGCDFTYHIFSYS